MKITCEFRNLSLTELYYTCIVTSAVINKPNTKFSAFSGTHLEGKSNKDVECVQFKYVKIEYFPRGVGQLFRNLTVLHLSCGLKEITRQDLVGLNSLTELYLQDNQLISLPSNLLEDMRKLKRFVVNEKKLEFVNSRMFECLRYQEEFFLSLKGYNLKVFSCSSDLDDDLHFDSFMKRIDRKFKNPLEDLTKSQLVFKELWDSRQYSDFTIKVGQKEIKVHKNVLGTQSSVFAAMFEIDMKEKKSSEMTIEEFSSSSVEEFVEYFYTGLILNETNTMEIFELAAKYDVESLKLEMAEWITYNIDENNAIELLELGNLHKSEVIISAAFKRVMSANPGIEFSDHLKLNPEKVIELIGAKRKHDQDLKVLKKKFVQDSEDVKKIYNEFEERLKVE